ncbi:DUF4219 domain-containing protein/UBN2 domain-containing protein [Senna tora]|uniref:DUF4219 domain-containing protein/UBN2 domain-containing protein n=1 Tax=Senna tora TaxID=362788 RepID=A0A834WL66_9FABA|nr:DUF4219 domain-containing protein/UBN2 domain-containing protein [Senna tora]
MLNLENKMTTRHHPFIQGHSIKRPPLFDGTNYALWKIKMKIFIQSQNVDVWRVISQGPHVITRPESEWNESDSKKVQLNSQAIHYLFCAVNSSLFKFICKCSSAKEMWEKLQGMYEETEEVRKSRIYMLNSQYESFRMEEGEGVEEMFGRFETIVYELEFLGKCFSEGVKLKDLVFIVEGQSSGFERNWEAKYNFV